MDFIERVINRCDYYILIIAGKYGSTSEDGLSFTEKEFRYAHSKGIPILAFLRTGIDDLPQKMVETDEKSKAKLSALIQQLKENSIIDYWSNPNELATKALAALS